MLARARRTHAAGPPLFEVELLHQIPPALLDRRLAAGWFRVGPLLMRADSMPIEDEIRGLLHIRLPLDRPTESRSLRRLMRRNRARLRCEIGAPRIDAGSCRLYEVTKPRFTGFVCSDLQSLVYGEPFVHVERLECRVLDGDRLVAVSYFDLGEQAIASQLALHDPDYHRYGLGFYTMLEEIEYARSTGRRFFYPGYVVPGLGAFDYKLRIGDVQYMDAAGRWRRRARPPERMRGAERQRGRVAALGRALAHAGLSNRLRFYPGFWMGRIPELPSPGGGYLRHGVHFRCGGDGGADDGDADDLLLAEYDAEGDVFVLCRAYVDRGIDLLTGIDPFSDPRDLHEVRALVYADELARSASAPEIARAARRASAR